MTTVAVPAGATGASGAPPAARQQRAHARVYVSSAALDLHEARSVVIDTVRRSGCEPVAMESYGADGRRPIERCLLDVESCEVYIGLVAWRYGSCPPGESKSFTHLEYETAVGSGKQILLFHLDEAAAWPTAHVDRSQRDVRHLRDVQSRDHVVDRFATLDQLATGVRQALFRLFGSGPAASVPELLPYVVDRHAQKETLAERGRTLDHSPSVIVVHGAADQVHHKFVEYMYERLLTRYLDVGQVHPVSVALRPDELGRPATITRRVADSCGLDPTLDVAALARQLHDFGSLTMLRFPVKVDVRRGRPDTAGVRCLVEYFDGWPRDRPLRVLPVISAQYADTRGGFLRRSGSARRDGFARAVERAAVAPGGCAVVVLPELLNVEEVEVEVWAEQDEVRRFLGDRDPIPVIRRMFRDHERSSKESGMPMEELAEELTRLLHHLAPGPGDDLTLDLYTARRRVDTVARIPAPASVALADPAAYIPDDGLVDAVNVALLLGQPLLLTGEPGCGKTQLATNLAWSLGLEPLLTFETKSDSTAESLFYRYDSLRHFEAASRGAGDDPFGYVTWNALGAAVLATLPPDERSRFVPDGPPTGPRRSVVLIDEIDKAPRDFPNDVLNELEHLYFRIPECGGAVVRADAQHRPIVVITSNSERDLPEPFLRRCVFHHIAFPDQETVRRIALNHLGSHVRGLDRMLDDAVALFGELRSDGSGLSRRPGLAEFLNWMVVLGRSPATADGLSADRLRGSIGVLAKTAVDVQRADAVVAAWLARRGD